ncbi:MAG: hypothetical protein ACJA0S_000083 [Rickettsiales bacterium]|jgi:hypothetical protein
MEFVEVEDNMNLNKYFKQILLVVILLVISRKWLSF